MLQQYRVLEQPRFTVGLTGTLLVHLFLGLLLMIVPAYLPEPARRPAIDVSVHNVTPLVAPPVQLSQRAPNTGKVSSEVNLRGLLARNTPVPTPPAPTRPAAPKQVDLPPSPAPKQPDPEPAPPAPAPQPEPPSSQPQGELTARNTPAPPAPPEIQPTEKPKLAFETPRSQAVASGVPRVFETPKRTSVEEAGRAIARGGGGGGLAVGDLGSDGSGGLGEALRGSPSLRSGLELLSDPMGADFKPYLIQILSTVRRNWLAVLPESARLGRRGKVQIQFSIDRSGAVPKLVIALASGTDALDRAAVAGISASNPFPPLPGDFKGQQVRLQFTFLYNIPNR
jgi:TonB family protein